MDGWRSPAGEFDLKMSAEANKATAELYGPGRKRRVFRAISSDLTFGDWLGAPCFHFTNIGWASTNEMQLPLDFFAVNARSANGAGKQLSFSFEYLLERHREAGVIVKEEMDLQL